MVYINFVCEFDLVGVEADLQKMLKLKLATNIIFKVMFILDYF